MNKVLAFLIVIILILIGLLIFLNSNSQDTANRKAFGNNGLGFLLNNEDLETIPSAKISTQKANDFSVRVLPLSAFIRYFSVGGEFDFSISASIYDVKLSEMPSLVIMPKWNFSKNINILNKDALIPTDTLNRNIKSFSENSDTYDYIARIQRPNDPTYTQALTLEVGKSGESDKFGEISKSANVFLYMPQFFDPDTVPESCDILLSSTKGVLIYKCDEFDNDTYYLSDPDLLNNHGLSQGENAAFAIILMSQLRGENGEKPIYLDTSTRVFPSDNVKRGEDYDRSLNDVKGLFDYPLGIIWGSIFLVAALCLWRGFYRFGLPLRNTVSKIEFSKNAAISSVARLLRLSGNDGRLVSQFVQGLLNDKAVAFYGRTANNEAGVQRLFKRFERIDAPVAKELELLAQALINDSLSMTSSELYRKLEKFQELLRSIDIGTK